MRTIFKQVPMHFSGLQQIFSLLKLLKLPLEVILAY